MLKNKVDINKFNFGQLTSNSNGKTSASATAGLYVVAIGGLCFLLGAIDKLFFSTDVDIMIQSALFVGIGVGLLGYRKSKDSDIKMEEVKEDPKNTDIPLNS